MGGILATAAAELAPELFAHLVYVSAFAPVSGLPGEAYFFAPEGAGSLIASLLAADWDAVGALRLDNGDQGRHAAIRETFFGDVDDVTAAAAISLLTPDASTGVSRETFPVTAGRYGAIPHTYVTCARDKAVPFALNSASSRRSTPSPARRRRLPDWTPRTRRSCRSPLPSRP